MPRDRGSHGAVRLSWIPCSWLSGESPSEREALYPSRTCSKTFLTTTDVRTRMARTRDEEVGSGIVMAGFPPEEHIAVVYRVRDGLIDDVVPLM